MANSGRAPLDAPVALAHLLMGKDLLRLRRIVEVFRNIPMQRLLFALERRRVVAATRHPHRRRLELRVHRVSRHHSALHVQQVQQFRQRRNLVRLPLHCPLLWPWVLNALKKLAKLSIPTLRPWSCGAGIDGFTSSRLSATSQCDCLGNASTCETSSRPPPGRTPCDGGRMGIAALGANPHVDAPDRTQPERHAGQAGRQGDAHPRRNRSSKARRRRVRGRSARCVSPTDAQGHLRMPRVRRGHG